MPSQGPPRYLPILKPDDTGLALASPVFWHGQPAATTRKARVQRRHPGRHRSRPAGQPIKPERATKVMANETARTKAAAETYQQARASERFGETLGG